MVSCFILIIPYGNLLVAVRDRLRDDRRPYRTSVRCRRCVDVNPVTNENAGILIGGRAAITGRQRHTTPAIRGMLANAMSHNKAKIPKFGPSAGFPNLTASVHFRRHGQRPVASFV